MKWTDKKLVSAKILSVNGGICKIRTAGKISIKGISPKVVHTNYGYVSSFMAKKGETYRIKSI
jgi:alpha-L-fucosidase 2